MAVGDLAEAGVKEADDSPRHGVQHLGAIEPSIEIFIAPVSAAELAEVGSRSDAHQSGSEQNGAVGEALRRSVFQCTNAQPNGQT